MPAHWLSLCLCGVTLCAARFGLTKCWLHWGCVLSRQELEQVKALGWQPLSGIPLQPATGFVVIKESLRQTQWNGYSDFMTSTKCKDWHKMGSSGEEFHHKAKPSLSWNEGRGQEDVFGRYLRNLSDPPFGMEEEWLHQGHLLRDHLNLTRCLSFCCHPCLLLLLLSNSVLQASILLCTFSCVLYQKE